MHLVRGHDVSRTSVDGCRRRLWQYDEVDHCDGVVGFGFEFPGCQANESGEGDNDDGGFDDVEWPLEKLEAVGFVGAAA